MAAGHDRLQRRAPRIVLNATALTEGGSGVQTYERELLAALGRAAGIPAHVTAMIDRAAGALVPMTMARSIVRADTGVRRKVRGLRRVAGADLVHGLDVDIPLSNAKVRPAPIRPAPIRIATVHDLAQLDAPWAFGRGGAAKRALTRYACRHADALIAVSNFTAERIRAHFGRDAVVIGEAPGRGFVPPSDDAVEACRTKYRLPDPCVLYVGNVEPRKDVPTLAAACRRADLPLVVTGGAIDSVALPGDVIRIGYVGEAELPALYCAATVVGYVSRYEGYGLPPVEALASGATVMATRTGALVDVAPEGIEYVPVGDAEAQAAALRDLVADPERRAARRAAGAREVAALSWDRTATETAAVWFDALGKVAF